MPLQQPPSATASAAASIKQPRDRAMRIVPSLTLARGAWRLDTDHVAIGPLHLSSARYVVRIGFAHFRLSHQEEVGVIAGQPLIERRRQTLARSCRLDEMRRDDDDQIGLMLLIVHAAEQGSEHRNRSEPRNLRPKTQVV